MLKMVHNLLGLCRHAAMSALLFVATCFAAASAFPFTSPLKVGIAWGGDVSPNGKWGCDSFCVERTGVMFIGDKRFTVERHRITNLSPKTLENLDVLVMPGGNNDFDELYGGAGQLAALGSSGLDAIGNAVERGTLYVGICAGAFLGCQRVNGEYGGGIAGPGLDIHDEKNFGCASVRGLVDLDIAASDWSGYFKSWSTGLGYDDGPAILVDETMSNTVALANYCSKVQVEERDLQRTRDSYKAPGKANELIGKAAVTLTTRGKGKILLVGPHPELSPTEKGKDFLNLIHALCESNQRQSKDLRP